MNGQTRREIVWSFYTIVNYLGALLCFVFVCLGYWKKKKQFDSGNILVGLLCTGIFCMAIPCATICALSMWESRRGHELSESACFWEAYFHIMAIVVQFYSNALFAYKNYLFIVKNRDMTRGESLTCCVILWVVSAVVTALFGKISPARLQPAGNYCFFDFDSPGIRYWLVPSLVLAILMMIFFYGHVYSTTRNYETWNGQAHHPSTRFLKRAIVLVTLMGTLWFGALVATLYAWTRDNTITPALDEWVGICGSAHSVAVPVVYGYFAWKQERKKQVRDKKIRSRDKYKVKTVLPKLTLLATTPTHQENQGSSSQRTPSVSVKETKTLSVPCAGFPLDNDARPRP